MLSIEVRVILVCMLVGFVLSLLGGTLILPTLKSMKAKQSIRELGPESHKTKEGTPTMGGLIIILSFSVVCFFITKDPKTIFILMVAFIGGMDPHF